MVWSSPLYCLNSPMFAIQFLLQPDHQSVNVVCRAQPSDRTKGGREMQEKGWRRGGHTWLTKNPMENGGPFWFWMGLNQAKWWNMLVSPWNMEVSYGWNNGSCVIVPLSSILWKKNTTQTKQTSTKTEVNVREKEGETVDWGDKQLITASRLSAHHMFLGLRPPWEEAISICWSLGFCSSAFQRILGFVVSPMPSNLPSLGMIFTNHQNADFLGC